MGTSPIFRAHVTNSGPHSETMLPTIRIFLHTAAGNTSTSVVDHGLTNSSNLGPVALTRKSELAV